MAWQAFRERVAAHGATLVGTEWLGSNQRHRIICKNGHETTAHPSTARDGQGICRFCAHMSWDMFYVVTNDSLARVKFGITSANAEPRLQVHRRNGYRTVIRTMTDLPTAPDLERSVLATLRLAGTPPVHGREYFDLAALPVILDVADNWVPLVPRPRPWVPSG